VRIPLSALPLLGDLVDVEYDDKVTTGEVVGMSLGESLFTSCGPADDSDPHVWVQTDPGRPRFVPVRDLRI